jgi:uncharacterized protein (UPF0261 family)
MNIRATGEEMEKLGQVVAEKLNRARGPVAFILPLRGWSVVGAPGGPLYDPDANQRFITALRSNLSPRVRLVEMDALINDPEVADQAVRLLDEEMRRQSR